MKKAIGIIIIVVSVLAFIYGGVILMASDSKDSWIWLLSILLFVAGIYITFSTNRNKENR
jgi:hypothetical protein